ncbi:nuclease-related domain-containing protein [Acidisphaera sp. S103]|uniref:nuclease-related domain-containing protein n=1 Tax=Acidisphaera sp. S103 TaxID=1747223 RepID=UPI00131CFC74|nr:nuclease-related domain-containing protein [Acidisphaera sp. S103]
MTVRLYGGDYRHDQENRAFRLLCSRGLALLTGDAAIIGNIEGDGCQIDALVLGCRSITIVDFKDCGGAVRISENGEWRTDDGFIVRGGRRDANPYEQVRRYKQLLISYLKAERLLPPPNDLSHISGLVMFTRPMVVDDSGMGERAGKWFRAAAQQDAMDFLRDRASPHLDLSADRMDSIVGALGVKPYKLQPSETWVPAIAVERAKRTSYFEAMQEADYVRQAEREAENGDRAQSDYTAACQGWAIHDALKSIRSALESRHPGTAFPEEVVSAMELAVLGGQPPLSAVIRKYQPRTDVDLENGLQSWGVDPNVFA